ncbi:branched-chain amino acid ABC transporter permease [Desulfomonile tiedjei]|uniref:Amino acid/amide ABC transporter membrane protein 2, HAAT family n=1 Tax=Desulfomonile tiedjei (strain ATCC 49306 / DSM 6799 / DCB-1) TaxID=706587 RepID=I4C563_DESTA|nr:branched-chain amino acid ABC transporter permease [Desulfomonile tiedjei]AFM24704.1 amino acid/amide ABC transporter membrane protein 2, HAAT family [Desulfomonile tiedjei DSM 6799]
MEIRNNYKEIVFWAILFVIFGSLPIIGSSSYHLMLASHILLWGLFAVAFNMLWGVTGMLSFGQALYFGLGGYAVGLMVRHVGDAWFVPGIGLGLIAAAILSLAIGLLIIRVSGVFFTVLTLAFGQLVWQITFRWYEFTGGDDGIQGIIPPGILSNKVTYYYVTLVIVIASIWLLRRISLSPLGVLLRCVRQNPNRVSFIGQSVRYSQLRIYMVSSVFSALAGSLMAGIDNSIHTDMLYWTTSGEVILMSVLGGIGQFFGPLIGTAVFIVIQEFVGAKTEYWPLIIGLIMMTMVLLFPRGLVGEFQALKTRLQSRMVADRG